MSDKISERKPDGGLKEWIDFYEMVADGDEDQTELLMLLIELRAHRLRAADAQEVRPICVRQAIANMENHDYCDSINVAYKYGWNDAIKAAVGTVESESD